MRSRFRAGQAKRNLWQYLAELEDDTLQERNSAYEDLLPESLSIRRPSSVQLNVIRRLIKLGLLDPEAKEKPLFDKAGRSRFRKGLAGLLSYAFQTVLALEKLLSSREIRQFTASEVDGDNHEVYKRVQDAAFAAADSLKLLWSLRKEFSHELQETLKWISTVLGIRKTTLWDAYAFAKTGDKNPSSSITASLSGKGDSSSVKFDSSSPVKHDKPRPPPLSELDESVDNPTSPTILLEEDQELEEGEEAHDQFPPLHDLASGDTELSRELGAQRRLQALSLDDKQEVSDHNLEMESLAMDPYKGWAHAASRLIQLLCTPIEALDCLIAPG